MNRKGFSLIELLIVVAIIAALVGVAVPFFQDNLQEAQITKAKQDLDVIRNAINLHDAQNRDLVGTDLQPLVGRYLQELPTDPWGNEYLLDANVGLVITFGADAQAGGTGGDADQPVRYKPTLRIQQAQYEGPWGHPKEHSTVIITMTKPFDMVAPADLHDELEILTNTRRDDGRPVSLNDLDSSGDPTAWATDQSNAVKYQKPQDSMFAFGNGNDVTDSDAQRITPTMAVNFEEAANAGDMDDFGLEEAWLANGPMDDAIYGTDVRDLYQQSAEPIPRYQGKNRGVKIERF